jgi:catechol 2,3-dioxygenase-like lactoylglutathione lyase family enzyme
MNSGPPLHHVGIIQPSEEDAFTLMALLGLKEEYRGYVETWQALCIFTKPEGATPIEFVVPNGGPLAKFNKGFGGLHHIALTVKSLDTVKERMEQRGMKLLNDIHVRGAGPFFCNFLSPIFTRSILVEFIELIPDA